MREIFNHFRTLAAPFWLGSGRWRASAYLVALIFLLLVQAGLAVLINEQTGEFISALAAQDAPRFWRAVWVCVLWLSGAVPVFGFYYFFRDTLANAWRRQMTDQFLTDYFRDRLYYELNVHPDFDNPDQRMVDDINTFTQRALFFVLVGLGALLQLLAFSGVLWSISASLVGVLLVYAVAGTWISVRFFGRPLMALNFLQIRLEADFRFELIRVRSHAESIALYRGEAQEHEQVQQRFASVLNNQNAIIRKQRSLNLLQSGYGMFAVLLPGMVIAGRVLSGELEVGSAVRAAGAFAAMLSAISLVVDNFENLSRFVASIHRLHSFAVLLLPRTPVANDFEGRIERLQSPNDLVLESLTVQTPDRSRVLIRNLSLVVPQGDHLMIVGSSGSGKSSLLRAVAGLWQAGSGRIFCPGLSDIMFLPQQPYLQAGKLRDQLLYPHRHLNVCDEDLLHLLIRVRLAHLAAQPVDLQTARDWDRILSVGEQQRLAFARVLLHRPLFTVLDEATSALDAGNEAHLYAELTDTTTLVSVGHRASILRYHKRVLEFTGNGQWCMHLASTYQFRG